MATGRTALGVFRGQPFHRGHTNVICQMIQDYDNVIIGLGSTGRHSEPANPWTQVHRQEMLRNVFGNRVKILPLQDIGAEQGSNTWCEYVLTKAENLKFPEITDYFTGSVADSIWYRGMFNDGNTPVTDLQLSPSGTCRKLHIIERSNTIYPSATEIRTFLTTRSDEWKKWVPAVNHELIESTYPEEFKIKPY